jgi:hypothetical protein
MRRIIIASLLSMSAVVSPVGARADLVEVAH